MSSSLSTDALQELFARFQPKELPLKQVLAAVDLRLKHFIDECPQRNVIFEVDSDASEEVLVKVVQKLCTRSAHVDVILHDAEYHFLVANRLKTCLNTDISITSDKAATVIRGNGRDNVEFILSLGPMRYFMEKELARTVQGEKRENAAVVLYRTEHLLDGQSITAPEPMDTVAVEIAPFLCHIYRLVDLLPDESVLLKRLQDFAKRYSDPIITRYLSTNMESLIKSAKESREMVNGRDYAFTEIDGKRGLTVAGAVRAVHPCIAQFLQLHHSLPASRVEIPGMQRSPLHFLKTYSRTFGVFRRGGYELRNWLPFMTQLPSVYPARIYEHSKPLTPLHSIEAVGTVSEWIGAVERVMGMRRKIPQSGVYLIVCPSDAARQQLWRYMKYSHIKRVQTMALASCSSIDQAEKAVYKWPEEVPIVLLTTAANFETWHTRYMGNSYDVTVILGTPSEDVHYLHRAYRFARTVVNVVTVPLEKREEKERSRSDSGIDSGSEEEQRMRLQALQRVENRSHWMNVFVTEMWERGVDWKAQVVKEHDLRYEKIEKWMVEKWMERKEEDIVDFDDWKIQAMKEWNEKWICPVHIL